MGFHFSIQPREEGFLLEIGGRQYGFTREGLDEALRIVLSTPLPTEPGTGVELSLPAVIGPLNIRIPSREIVDILRQIESVLRV